MLTERQIKRLLRSSFELAAGGFNITDKQANLRGWYPWVKLAVFEDFFVASMEKFENKTAKKQRAKN